MSNRITQDDLQEKMQWLNVNTKSQYVIERAYGGYTLISVLYGSRTEISPRVSGREMYNILYTMQSLILNERCKTT